jgi:hypothetical protein
MPPCIVRANREPHEDAGGESATWSRVQARVRVRVALGSKVRVGLGFRVRVADRHKGVLPRETPSPPEIEAHRKARSAAAQSRPPG